MPTLRVEIVAPPRRPHPLLRQSWVRMGRTWELVVLYRQHLHRRPLQLPLPPLQLFLLQERLGQQLAPQSAVVTAKPLMTTTLVLAVTLPTTYESRGASGHGGLHGGLHGSERAVCWCVASLALRVGVWPLRVCVCVVLRCGVRSSAHTTPHSWLGRATCMCGVTVGCVCVLLSSYQYWRAYCVCARCIRVESRVVSEWVR